jgi:hypothetical protein
VSGVREAVFDGVRHVTVDNLGAGSIVAEPGPPSGAVECSITAADEGLLNQVQIRQAHDQLWIGFPTGFFRSSSTHLRLGVPDGLSYLIKVGSADVSITPDMARSKITSGSGDIRLGKAADLDCAAGSGDITIAALSGNAAKISSGSGSIAITAAHCPVSAKSGSGEVLLQSLHQSALRASSGSGDIAVPTTTGSVDLRSASGSLSVGVADNLAAWLDLHSVSGEIRIDLESAGPPEPGESYVSLRGRTASGDIAVYRS